MCFFTKPLTVLNQAKRQESQACARVLDSTLLAKQTQMKVFYTYAYWSSVKIEKMLSGKHRRLVIIDIFQNAFDFYR